MDDTDVSWDLSRDHGHVPALYGNETTQYTAQSIPVGIIDEDQGEASKSLIRYIDRTNEIIYLEDDRETLQENLFYRNVEYIVRIPRNFMEQCILGDAKLEVTTVPGTYSGSYVEQQISNFINFARCYGAADSQNTSSARRWLRGRRHKCRCLT